jgi:L-2-hydroxyglutarate oxidase LhgO
MTDRIDALVIGAGVIGLAIARELALAGHEVIVIDQAEGIGTGTSSRNSEVIHAGLYYAPGSLKAQLCVEGRDALVAYCAERGIAHRRYGKLVVAVDDSEVPALEALHAQAQANGVADAQLISGAAARAMEPVLNAVAALHSPCTGIIDSHAYMLALQGDAEDRGAAFAFHSPFEGAAVTSDGFDVRVGGAEPTRMSARLLINAAGLHAVEVASRIDGLDARHIPKARLCKGHYFALTGRAPFSRLVYPMHNRAGLGVHFTLDLGGQGKFGPDVEWLPEGAAENYVVDVSRAATFADEIRRYWPTLPDAALAPAYCGIRPKIAGPGEPAADFRIDGAAVHGVRGLVNLFGIESPGLTASLSLAARVLSACAQSHSPAHPLPSSPQTTAPPST